jgi:hypothetical protein
VNDQLSTAVALKKLAATKCRISLTHETSLLGKSNAGDKPSARRFRLHCD